MKHQAKKKKKHQRTHFRWSDETFTQTLENSITHTSAITCSLTSNKHTQTKPLWCLSTLLKTLGIKKHLKSLFKNLHENGFNIPSGTVKWNRNYLEAKRKKTFHDEYASQIKYTSDTFIVWNLFCQLKILWGSEHRWQLEQKHPKLPVLRVCKVIINSSLGVIKTHLLSVFTHLKSRKVHPWRVHIISTIYYDKGMWYN